MPKTLAVVIPCYNYAHFLPECLDSVFAQSQKADQVIVVDDESTDETQKIARNYPVSYIWQKNKGLSGARNTGIIAAGTTHIMCLDADDILRPDSIKEHMALIKDMKDVAQCGLMYFGTQNATFRPLGATLETLLKSNTVYCDSVFPKKAWEDIGGFDESDTMRLGLEDWLAWIEMAACGYRFKTSDYIGLLYRRHPSAMTFQTTHPRWNEITEYMRKKVLEKYGLKTDIRSIAKPTI